MEFYFDSSGIGHGYLLSKDIFTATDVPAAFGIGATVKPREVTSAEVPLPV